MDLDEVLVRLWDVGLEYAENPNRTIHKRDLARAQRALNIATRKELMSPSYWCHHLDLTEETLMETLAKLEISVRPGAKRLPKGAISKLKNEALSRGKSSVRVLNEHENPNSKTNNGSNLQPVIWEPIGRPRELNMINESEVLAVHEALVQDFQLQNDPIDPSGVRNWNQFSSAIHRPQTSFGNKKKYPTAEMAAAGLLHSIVLDHPFHNGNKRTAMVAMLVFLDENGLMLTCAEGELFKEVLLSAQHRLPNCIYNEGEAVTNRADREVLELARWIHSNSREIEQGNRTIQWRRLKKILNQYDCNIEHAGRNRLNITRTISVKGFLGRTRSVTLKSQVYCGGDGRDAEPNTISKLRKDLHLDEENGNIDTAMFYGAAPSSPDDFINRYRKTLKRLSHL